MEQAAQVNLAVARNVKADQLTLPTPCHDWDVRTLANHLTFWSAFRSEVAARKQTPPSGGEGDVDYVTGRRALPEAFDVDVDAEKVADAQGNHLQDIVMTFRVRFPDGDGGDAARRLLPDIIRKSHERLCTVSRTIILGTDITVRTA